jgi:hypothetical protein
MVWYIAVIAILNLALGYALAVMLGAGKTQPSLAAGDTSEYGDAGDAP